MDQIHIGSLKVNGVGGASWVSLGPQTAIGVTSVIKSVQGVGQIDGDFSSLPVFSALVDDIDWIDSPTWVFTQIAPPL